MYFKSLAVLAALVPAVLSDFSVYCGQNCVNDGAGCPVTCIFTERSGGGDTGGQSSNIVNDNSNDASGPCGGLACDGCDISKNARDWELTRLEMNNSQRCSPSRLVFNNGGSDPHFTIYDDRAAEFSSMLEPNGNEVGRCYRSVAPKDELSEFGGISSNFMVHQYDCKTAWTVIPV